MQNVSDDVALFTDDELVVVAQTGDNQAFAELVKRHRSSCLRLAISILHDYSDAEDEVQNALWRAFEHVDRFNRDAKFSTWLGRIVVNQCLIRLRRQKREWLIYIEDVTKREEHVMLDLPDGTDGPEVLLGKAEVASVLRQEIRGIPPLLRKVFLLRDVEQLPMPAVAAMLGISVAAAKSRLLRARFELRGRLRKHQGQRVTQTA